MTYLYLISEGREGPSKIGVSQSPEGRLRELQSGNARRLRLVKKWHIPNRWDAFRKERELHSLLDKYTMVGEWFNLWEDDVRCYMDGHVYGYQEVG